MDFLPAPSGPIRPRLAQPENLKRRLHTTDSIETKTATSKTPSHYAYNVRKIANWLRLLRLYFACFALFFSTEP